MVNPLIQSQSTKTNKFAIDIDYFTFQSPFKTISLILITDKPCLMYTEDNNKIIRNIQMKRFVL